MIKVLGRSGNLAGLLRSTTPLGASSVVPAIVPQPVVDTVEPRPILPVKMTAYTASGIIPAGKIKVVTGPAVTTSVRYAHTDLQVPNYTNYRKPSCRDPTVPSKETEAGRKLFTYLVIGTAGAGLVTSAKFIVTSFLSSLAPAADVLAVAKLEINLSEIPEGKNVTFKFRGKPLFVRHRTAQEIAKERAVDASSLRHPETDEERTKDPDWLIVYGICTHLGCVPIAYQGEWNGYYCPCHGSHYDAAGRIRKGPAPLNLEIPEYEFISPGVVVVG